jgi:hypothetical protein
MREWDLPLSPSCCRLSPLLEAAKGSLTLAGDGSRGFRSEPQHCTEPSVDLADRGPSPRGPSGGGGGGVSDAGVAVGADQGAAVGGEVRAGRSWGRGA